MQSEKIIFIPKGSTKGIITHLSAKGYSVSMLDAYFLRFVGRPQSGYIEIPQHFIQSYHTTQTCQSLPNSDLAHTSNLLNLSQDLIQKTPDCTPQIFEITLTRANFLQALATSKAAMKSVTLIPGETNYFFLREIARVFELDRDKLEQYYNQHAPYSDGVILANTYSLPYHAKEEAIIQMLLTQSLEKHKALANELLGRYNEREWFEIVAKASIIQKEAANVAEMPIVSSVIDNRIAKNMPLQMDGSLNYGKYSHTRITPDRIRNDLSEFNTYKHVGIPKTPSGSVSIDAIKAAINPAKTDYLYFMRNKNGTHDFTSTYKEHLQNIKKAQQKK